MTDLAELAAKLDKPLANLAAREMEMGVFEAGNLRGDMKTHVQSGDQRELARTLRRVRQHALNVGNATIAEMIPADLPVPAAEPAQVRAEEQDPLERAFDEGAEARANGISRRDNPHQGEEREAWDQGWRGEE